ncbi:hypothetical protein CP118TE_12930 [Clostridium perfringens E]|uniref:DUF4355 domain-containing protein n=1 Tax=Clostridium perfringens TaxID=1502 RepID=UPI00220ED51B|nr:DUF4355 domain-containing protein [Clostridium perfringens]BDC01584.1 hypothetical protein CP118TE_12930 [Clostridium perfringens E]
MKRNLIMNLQLFGLGGVSRPFLNADGGAGNGGAGTTTGGEGTNGGSTGEGAEGSEGDKSFDDVLKDKKYQSEFDKRIAKALETAKSKWETEKATELENAKTEAEKLAKMNAEQKAKYAEEKRIAELEKREKDITTRELKAQAYETLAEKNLPKELIGTLNFESAETCNASIEAVEKAFQNAVAKAVNDKLRGGEIPKGGQGSESSTFGFNFQGVRPKSTK